MSEATGPITHARVLKIALPIVLSNATVPILGAVDTGVVGQLGEAAPIGAVGMGAVILDHAVVGENSIVAAGSVVLQNTIIEPGSIYAGVPAKRVKSVDKKQTKEMIEGIAENYLFYASWYKDPD